MKPIIADNFGRPYATTKTAVAGTLLEADGGFTCIAAGAVLPVGRDAQGDLYIPCHDGQHNLDGQLDGKTVYIGLYQAPDDWLLHDGLTMPVDVAASVQVSCRNGEFDTGEAGKFEWRHSGDGGDILTFRRCANEQRP